MSLNNLEEGATGASSLIAYNAALGRLKRRWEDNIKMDRREMGWGVVDWIHLSQYRD
jgi:hypothetical protein